MRPSHRHVALALLLIGSLSGAWHIPPSASAQTTCATEVEPNQPETDAPQRSGAFCLSAELPGDDQDFLLWDLSAAAPDQTWTLRLTGSAGVLTRLEAYAVDSEPGAPIRAGRRLVELGIEPGAEEPALAAGLLLPDRVLIGIGRSDLPDGGEPAVSAYTLEGLAGSPLGVGSDVEPNDDFETASAVEGTVDLSGDLAGSDDVYAWTVAEESPPDGWRIDARGVAGTGLRLTLRDPTGRSLAGATADGAGLASLRDLRLSPGILELRLSGGPREGPSPYGLTIGPDVGPGDREPNDEPGRAAPLELGIPTPGRLTGPTDVDFYRLHASEEGAASLLDVRLIWRSGATRELCLTTVDRRSLQCRRGEDGIQLKDLFLPDGHLFLSVSGTPDPDDPYVLLIDTTRVPAAGLETEPNDDVDVANALPVDLRIQGSGARDDVDLFAASVSGDPRLWRLDVQGSAIERVEWVRADGYSLGSAEIAPDRTAARLFDMYFVPGQTQIFRVRATDGDYSLALTPLGPPDPNGEREPNDGQAFTDTLVVGTPRTGRVATTPDVDEYRFTAAATDHLILHVESPADGDLDLRLTDDAGLNLAHVVPEGVARDLDLLLRAGDYRLVLRSDRPSEGRYAVRLDRGDPFELSQDQEPNDSPGWASALEGNGRVVGTGRPEGDVDWYLLPPRDVDTRITITTEPGVREVDVMTDAHTDVSLEADADGVTYRTGPLAGHVPHYIRVRSEGEHAFSVQGLPEDADRSGSGGLQVEATMPEMEVAAFWPAGQRLSGLLTIATIDGALAGRTMTVEAATSDARWEIAVTEPEVVIGATGAADVPFEVLIPDDVPADIPVRLSFRVRVADGTADGVASVDVVASRDALPVAPRRAWSVPDALLGGLDLASPALGADLHPSVDPDGEAALHDGLSPDDGGLARPIRGLPLTLTVDLAGETPIPVAGTIINVLSADPTFGDSPARFELDLSSDGTTWTTVLSGSLERSIRDQAFVLDEPVGAAFARLRILSTHREGDGRISLGEWKVVAVPGTPSPMEPLDLAEPGIGGHVTWTVPQLGRIELAQAMIDEDPIVLEPVPAEPGEPFSWAVGFFEGRVARITALEWTDPLATDPELRFDRLEVSVSEAGPLGPWRSLGTWHLERMPDGTVAPFTLDPPAWARFVRFVSEPARKDARTHELPAAIRISETPTRDGYRSILGQWGLGERAGPFEASTEPAAGIADDPDDDSREDPRPLAVEAEATGRVRQGGDTDWYAISVPAGQRSIHAVVGGDPYVAAELVLHESDGVEVPMSFGPGELAGTVLYEASVEPDADYLLEVRQPASSVVVTFDTSVSVGPYLDSILGALRGFGADVVTGREAVRILPFDGEALLRGWNDQPIEIQAAAATFVLKSSSSGAEANLARAVRDLAPRRGARAVLIITDAASSSYRATADLWERLAAVRPLVFAVQTGGLNEAPSWERHHLMSDWAASAGGVYRYAHSRADIETAFDHLATWLRRPAGYRLTVVTSADELPPPEPGRIRLTGPEHPSGRPQIVLADNVAVELVLDTSGSMLESIGRERRIDVAKRVLVDLVSQDLPSELPVALRVFAGRCESELLMPLGPLDAPSMIDAIREREVPRRAATPLAAAIEEVADDLAGASGPRVVVVLTDGRESCKGDPEAAVQGLVDAGFDVRVNIVGFALENRRDRRAMAELAELGGGEYFDARRADELEEALSAAISMPYRILDSTGAVVGKGTIGGEPITVSSSTYAVEVETDPPVRFEEVYVAPGETVELTLPMSEEPPAEAS
jgi:hypothetical protein